MKEKSDQTELATYMLNEPERLYLPVHSLTSSYSMEAVDCLLYTNEQTETLLQEIIRDSLVARITACRVVDRGSIPRRGASFTAQMV